jgi:hypothetical protein
VIFFTTSKVLICCLFTVVQPSTLAQQLGHQGSHHSDHGKAAVEDLGNAHAGVHITVGGEVQGVEPTVTGELAGEVRCGLDVGEPDTRLVACKNNNSKKFF